MATLLIKYRIEDEDRYRVVKPTRKFPLLLHNELKEHSCTLSEEIWDCIEYELKRLWLANKRVDKNSVIVTIDTDDEQQIIVPKEVILKCFE